MCGRKSETTVYIRIIRMLIVFECVCVCSVYDDDNVGSDFSMCEVKESHTKNEIKFLLNLGLFVWVCVCMCVELFFCCLQSRERKKTKLFTKIVWHTVSFQFTVVLRVNKICWKKIAVCKYMMILEKAHWQW